MWEAAFFEDTVYKVLELQSLIWPDWRICVQVKIHGSNFYHNVTVSVSLCSNMDPSFVSGFHLCVITLEWCLVQHFWVLKANFHIGLSKILNNVDMTRGKIISKDD